MIEVTKALKVYEMGPSKIKALDELSFEVSDKEFVSLVGPSGSGKSTLMNVIGALDSLDKGQILVDGEDISKYSDRKQADYRRRKIGFVFQTFNLQLQLTARENVEMPLIFGGTPAGERSDLAAEALEMVGLAERMDHTPNELSGGEQQRVSIARAIVNEPEILLADEPTGNLDSKTGEDIMRLLKDLNKDKEVTVIMVTHNLEHAQYAQRVFSMRDGKIENVKEGKK
jgi:putative ABC transport system ATP-binding protein